jgi:hypothetical protein
LLPETSIPGCTHAYPDCIAVQEKQVTMRFLLGIELAG